MFGRRKIERSREKWRTKPIEREHAGRLLPIPDTAALAEEIVDRAGVLDASSTNAEKALVLGKVEGAIWQTVIDRGSERLAQGVGDAAAEGMKVLIERDDFHPSMLFDYLSTHGVPEIIIHNKIVEYLTNEQFTIDFTEVVQETHATGELTKGDLTQDDSRHTPRENESRTDERIREEEVNMPISLSRGGNVSLSKEAPGLKDVVIGLGWDVRATEGSDFELDASLFMLKEDGKVRDDADFVFYNNKISPEGSVEHLGDNVTGGGAGDEERIKVDLDSVPSEVTKLSVAVTIHKAESRKQDFGMVNNAFIRVVDGANGSEIARYDLSDDASTETAMILGEIYRRGGEWKFRAVGQGFEGGLGPLASNYGVNVAGRESDSPPSESPNPPESARRKLSVSDLHRIITEALDRVGIQYAQNEDRDDLYFLGRDGVMLVVGARTLEGVPVAVTTQAFVLENVECTKELAADLLTRNGSTFAASWAIHDQPEGTVQITLSYEMSAEQLDVGLVERSVNWVLDKATAEIDALQATYGGKRKVVVSEEPPKMPEGTATFMGCYPGYEPARAMAAFLSASGESGRLRRPSYEERRDFWMFDGGGYALVVGCFAEPDRTPVIMVTYVAEPEYLDLALELVMGERSALQQSAHSTDMLVEKVHGITETVAAGALRQLRPSEVGPILGSVGS